MREDWVDIAKAISIICIVFTVYWNTSKFGLTYCTY